MAPPATTVSGNPSGPPAARPGDHVTGAGAIRLVVNADDFGASEAASQGVLRAHRDGIVTSTSVLGNCADADQVRRQLAEVPRLGVGVQLVLVGGRPVSDPAVVPSLVDEQGRFPATTAELYLRWAQNLLVAEQVERELDAQVARLRDVGLVLDHLDAHRHAGVLPVVGRALETVARRHRIEGLRSTVEAPNLSWITDVTRGAPLAVMAGLAWLTRRQMGALRHGPQTWGHAESGRLDRVRVLEILGRLGPGAHELICHPQQAPGSARQDPPGDPPGELGALVSATVRDAVARRRIQLVRWADLF